MSVDIELQRYKLTLSYDGTNYCGWQRQPKADQIGVEQRVEEVLGKIYGFPVDILGQGRTDAGVHAAAQTAHVDLPPKYATERILNALNSLLPADIRIIRVEEAENDFHARFDAISRSYTYRFSAKANPLQRHYVLSQFKNFDLSLMQEAAQVFLGEHDFTSFSIQASLLPHARCTVNQIYFNGSSEDEVIAFNINANRFLRRMVRRTLGTLLMVGLGRLTKKDILELLTHPVESDPRVYTASAHGLVLSEVIYE